MNPIPPAVRDIIVCPKCRGDLHDRPGWLVCAPCALAFPVVDGAPYLVIELARPSSATEPMPTNPS